jgi:hypothetical protein
MTPAERLATGARDDAATRLDRLCDADFFLGEDALAKGKKAAARRSFLDARRNCPIPSPSYTGAVAELRHR